MLGQAERSWGAGHGGLSQECSCAFSSEKEVWGQPSLEAGPVRELGELGGPPAEQSWGERTGNREFYVI